MPVMFESSRYPHRRYSLGDLHIGYNSETDGGKGVCDADG